MPPLNAKIGGFPALRKTTVPKIRDFDDKTVLIFEDTSADEPEAPFMAKNTPDFLRQAKLSARTEARTADGSTKPVEYEIVDMKDMEPAMVLRNCPVIREQNIQRLALKNLQKNKGQVDIWAAPLAERKARAKALRGLSGNYRLLA